MMMRKTKTVKFEILDCCGNKLGETTLRIPISADKLDYRHKAIVKAGFSQHICKGCYDTAYRAKEINWMSAYLYPNLKSKKAYKEAIASGETITARENYPWGSETVDNGRVCFEGPHYPKPHRFYGNAIVENGRVVEII
jgi:hypothetical protein